MLSKEMDKKKGQGLVEFALILPILLLLLLGIIEFGYLLTTYSGLFNAAREGSRYGAVHPWWVDGIEFTAREKVFIVNPGNPTVAVCCDMGPGEPTFYCAADGNGADGSCTLAQRPIAATGIPVTYTHHAQIGDRVVVSVTYDLPTITPLFSAIWPTLHVEAQSARTIASVGGIAGAPSPGGGGEICDNGIDDDGEGLIDCADPECAGHPACLPPIPGLSITKGPPSQTVVKGGTATFNIIVQNNGTADLTNVTISDGQADSCTPPLGNIGALAVGGGWSTTCQVYNVSGDFTNTASVNSDEGVSDSASANVIAIEPGTPLISISKSPDLQSVPSGADAIFNITVQNIGDVDLENVTVVDVLTPECDNDIGDLPIGSSASYACTAPDVVTDFVNNAVASGASVQNGQITTDDDDAGVNVLEPIVIDEPLNKDDTVVTGVCEPNTTVYVRDPQDPNISGSDNVGADGLFSFAVPPLQAGHTILVVGYGQYDSALVQGSIDDILINAPCNGDATVTGTAERGEVVSLSIPDIGYTDSTTVAADGTFTFSLAGGITLQFGQVVRVSGYGTSQQTTVQWCGTNPAIAIAPQCGVAGQTTITIMGSNWPPASGNVDHYRILWDGASVTTVAPNPSFNTTISVDVTDGPHTIQVQVEKSNNSEPNPPIRAQATFISPCPSPDLIITNLELASTGTISTYHPVAFTVTVQNVGQKPVNSLFWVDVYTTTPTSPTPGDGVAWGAVSSLGVGEETTILLTHEKGFPATGSYQVWAYADSQNSADEGLDEDNNDSGPIALSVDVVDAPPGYTTGTGAVSGGTLVQIGGGPSPAERARVYGLNLNTGDFTDVTYSDNNAEYTLEGLEAGVYIIMADTWVSGIYYSGSEAGIQVEADQTTTGVVIFLN